jgi:Ca2+/Na+ antiporter
MERGLNEDVNSWMRLVTIITILMIGTFYVLKKAAKVIEESTEVLSRRTKLAGGLLQSIGTAFPDMVLGVVAALVSSSLREVNYAEAISYAMMAAATTFGSNIYNIAHAAWCLWRQNKADYLGKRVLMWPHFKRGGVVRPIKEQQQKPFIGDLNTATKLLVALTIITAIVAVVMVTIGRVAAPAGVTGDVYQLIRPAGIVLFILCAGVMYSFRKVKRQVMEVENEENIFFKKNNLEIWVHLLVAGIAILLTAESMVHAVRVFCEITGMSIVIAGVLAGVIGCLGEMLVIHNHTVHPKGRLGDALVGVAMDNIVTTMGAAIVAILGGIFLGGNALIIIFVMILALNSVLMWQVGELVASSS